MVQAKYSIRIIEDFRTYLIQKKIDEDNLRQKILNEKRKKKYDNIYNDNYYEWIDNILEKPFNDCRKIILRLILAPYLINIKKYSYEESYRIIKEWLYKCDSVEKLDPAGNFFDYRINYALKNAIHKPQIGPMRLQKIKNDKVYEKLYTLLVDKGVL